jgi:hypothetical protein
VQSNPSRMKHPVRPIDLLEIRERSIALAVTSAMTSQMASNR